MQPAGNFNTLVLAKKNARWPEPSGTHFIATNLVRQNHTASQS